MPPGNFSVGGTLASGLRGETCLCLRMMALLSCSVLQSRFRNLVTQEKRELKLNLLEISSAVQGLAVSNVCRNQSGFVSKAQSVVLSLSWTLMSFGVYTELLQAGAGLNLQNHFDVSHFCQGAKTRTAQATPARYGLSSISGFAVP